MPFLRLLLCVALATVLPAFGAAAETLVLGAISDNAKKEYKRCETLAAYLEQELADAGVTEVTVSVFPTPAAATAAFAEGEIDFLFDSSLVVASVVREAGGEPFVRRWKDGVAEYHSLILVPTSSGMTSLADLVGKRIGFQAPDSTSGFMVPAAMLRRDGLTLTELSSRHERPAKDELGYVFTGDDKNTVIWLHSGWIDAAATDPENFAALEKAAPGAYRVLARSMNLPRHVGIHREGLDPALVDRITEELIAMESSEAGRKAMAEFNDTLRFDLFPAGVEATFEPIYGLLDELRALGIL